MSNNNTTTITNPAKSQSKPIAKQRLAHKFGSYFSKSPKLTNNRIASPKNSKNSNNKEQKQSNNQILFKNFAGTGLMVESPHSTSIQRLSNSTDNSTPHSTNSNSLDNRIFFPNDNSNSNLAPPLTTSTNINTHNTHNTNTNTNTRYIQLVKEYIIDTESTVSSSTDIQDDISSVASDEPHSWKRPPRIAPPPPPHCRPPPLPIPHQHNKHNQHNQQHSSSMTLIKRLILAKPAMNTDTLSLGSGLRIDINKKQNKNKLHKYSKSALSTPNSPKDRHKVTHSEIVNNPYLESLDFSAIIEHKEHKQINNALPPPLSPKNSGHLGHNMSTGRPSSASFKCYRPRQNSLPHYEIPNMNFSRSSHNLHVNDAPMLCKSRSANANMDDNNDKKRITKSVDMTDSYHKAKQFRRIHQRAYSARNVDELSLSEKLYQNRRTVLHRLSRGKNKKDVMSKLDISIGKVEEKLKIYVRNLVSLQDELIKCNLEMNKELEKWENINNFSLTNLCRSYYSNFALLIQIRIEIATKYCECFRDKYRQLKKTRDRIKKDAKKFSLDDLVLTVEAAMMTASNIRLPPDINIKRENEKSLKEVINELKKKYNEKKYEDIVQPMSAQDRTKHILTMLVQIIDTSNKTTMTKNVSDGLPYFHPKDNGYQVPFQQLLYDPRFSQKKCIDEFLRTYIVQNEINYKVIDKENLSLTKISTFIYKLTNSFLDSCELNAGSPFFQKLFWDCTNLMIGRSIFPKCNTVIKYVIDKDLDAMVADERYKKQLVWMSAMSQNRIGIEEEFCYYYGKGVKLKQTLKKPKFVFTSKKKVRKNNKSVFVNAEMENEEQIAYYKPINKLKELEDISVPQDSIVLVIDTIHGIQKCATRYSKIKHHGKGKGKSNGNLSGDSLFPIVVYCLIQSNVDYWNRWIFMMKKFYTEKILSFGQTGFCFSLINAAVTYILQQKPSNFGLDDDLL